MEKEKNKKFLLCASWKMNLDITQSIEYAEKLVNFLDSDIKNLEYLEIFIFPDFLSLYPVSRITEGTRVKIGAQNCFWKDKGPFTGEISPFFLKKLGCSYVIVGHPERIIQLKEDSQMINMKLKAVIKNQMSPLLLVFQRKEYTNLREAFKIIKRELLLNLEGIEGRDLKEIVIVFEPLWAIGSNRATSTEHVTEVACMIRNLIDSEHGNGIGKDLKLMYGGGVTFQNLDEMISVKNIDGIGMGKAALNYETFKKTIVKILENY